MIITRIRWVFTQPTLPVAEINTHTHGCWRAMPPFSRARSLRLVMTTSPLILKTHTSTCIIVAHNAFVCEFHGATLCNWTKFNFHGWQQNPFGGL